MRGARADEATGRRTRTARERRWGLVLLEAALAVVIFALAATIVYSVLRDGVEAQGHARQRERLVDLARSAMALIESGAASAESLNGPVRAWPESLAAPIEPRENAGTSRYELSVQTQPWGTAGLVLIEIRATWRGAGIAQASDEPDAGGGATGTASYTLKQLVRAGRPESAGAAAGDAALEGAGEGGQP
ncbi:MAG: hypothetical protein AB7K52_01495 [Phycisphaerales bacterium]